MRTEGECAEDIIVEGNVDGDNQLPGPSRREGQMSYAIGSRHGSVMTATTVGWLVLASG